MRPMLGSDKAAVCVPGSSVVTKKEQRTRTRILLHKNSAPQAPLKGDGGGMGLNTVSPTKHPEPIQDVQPGGNLH